MRLGLSRDDALSARQGMADCMMSLADKDKDGDDL